jgi:DNA helicase-2/ATP-dependent DNA helicase PcrA
LHAAKGLEWDAVFVVGVADGTLPIWRVLGNNGAVADEAAFEEERRLLYVGVTRAREHLRLSWSLSRTEGERTRPRRRSRFLHGLMPDDGPMSDDGPADSARDRPRGLDTSLLSALQEWRRDTAARLGVDAHAVFSANTLVAIAERRPRTERELVAVPGIGATKLQRYGGEVLAVVRRHISPGRK